MFAWRGLSKLRKMRDELLFANVERRLEAGVQGNLVAGDQFVGFVGHADHRLELLEHFLGHALGESRCRMGSDAVVAIVGDADGNVQEFFGQRIDCARPHDGFQVIPGAFEERGIVGDRLPEIIDVIGFARGHDVVVNGFDGGIGVFVFDKAESGHELAPWKSVGNHKNVTWNFFRLVGHEDQKRG